MEGHFRAVTFTVTAWLSTTCTDAEAQLHIDKMQEAFDKALGGFQSLINEQGIPAIIEEED